MKEAWKLALEALEYWDVHGKLHQPTEEAITAIKAALAQQDHSEQHLDMVKAQQEPWCMKMNGCTSKCEDCPVEVVEQEPVAWYVERQHIGFRDHGLKYGPFWKLSEAEELTDPIHILKPLYTSPPQPEERNFCPRCGKRTRDLTTIHTCTPPQENT